MFQTKLYRKSQLTFCVQLSFPLKITPFWSYKEN